MSSSENPVQNSPVFSVSEADLAASTGIHRKMLLVLRQTNLIAGVDWIKERKEIKLTANAAQKLRDAYARLLPGSLKSMSVEKTPPDPELEQKVAPLDAGERGQGVKAQLTELTVRGASPTNFKQLRALAPDGEPCLVRVQDTANFLPGSKLFARWISTGLYQFEGPYPRWRGDKLYRS